MLSYTIDFEITGPNFRVEEIPAALTRGSEVERWTVGQAVTRSRTATTAGIRIAIAKRSGKKPAEEALGRFFSQHASFLDVLAGLRSAEDEQSVRCIMCVYPDNASYLELSERVLHDLSRTGTSFVVAAWPCDSPPVEKLD